MTKLSELTGKTFGKLHVVSRAENSRAGKARWRCRCDCGRTADVLSGSLISGRQISCGCHRAKEAMKRVLKHGLSKTKEYLAWKNMISRCYRKQDPRYRLYGKRGITVCDRWRYAFENFLADMGRAPEAQYSIDRIDNGIGYEPGNCRWSTQKQQCRNKNNNVRITYQNETMTLIEWCELLDLPYESTRKRISDYQWPIERALSEPFRIKRKMHHDPTPIIINNCN